MILRVWGTDYMFQALETCGVCMILRVWGTDYMLQALETYVRQSLGMKSPGSRPTLGYIQVRLNSHDVKA